MMPASSNFVNGFLALIFLLLLLKVALKKVILGQITYLLIFFAPLPEGLLKVIEPRLFFLQKLSLLFEFMPLF